MAETLLSKNPETGELLAEFRCTVASDLPGMFLKASQAQVEWSKYSVRDRCRKLLDLGEMLIENADAITLLISSENGKPLFEAMSNEVQPCIDFLTHFAKKTECILQKQTVKILNPFLLTKRSYLEHWPLGTVLIISPWNYPFLLPFADIVMALAAGNSVILKPSEYSLSVGRKIQELCENSGLPNNLVQVVMNDGSIGSDLIKCKPAKIFFTGSAATGRKILKEAADFLIPVNLELSGKDVMIIREDADLEFATSAALWGGFSNSGQACASVERILVYENLKDPFVNLMRGKMAKLRTSTLESFEGELGVITSPKQASLYKLQIEDAKNHGAEIVTGGIFNHEETRLFPTLITSQQAENLTLQKDESFGPLALVETFQTEDEAIRKTNESRYGLAASIITRDLATARTMASQLSVGTVTINEVLYTAGIPGTPWGGIKESGFGRTHSDQALYEFTNVRHIHEPRSIFFTMKSLWWFPYTEKQYRAFSSMNALKRRCWIRKLRGLPRFITEFTNFLFTDRRL